MGKKRKPTKEELERLYNEARLSTTQIGKIYSSSSKTVSKWLKKFEIRARKGSEPWLPEGINKPTREELNRLYLEEKRSMTEISELYQVNRRSISRWMDEYKIKRRTQFECNLPKDFKEPTREELEKLYYEEGLSLKEIGKIYSVGCKIVEKLLEKNRLSVRQGNKKEFGDNFWKDEKSIVDYAMRIIEENQWDGLPSSTFLRNNGYGGFSIAISRYHGGVQAFRKKLGLDSSNMVNHSGYWDNCENVLRELNEVIEEIGHFPTGREIRSLGRNGLLWGIRKHGGMKEFSNIFEKERNNDDLEGLLKQYISRGRNHNE